MMLDEIDKMAPASTRSVQLCSKFSIPEQNNTFRDNYLNCRSI
jgi:ATP-dependent Lon protease